MPRNWTTLLTIGFNSLQTGKRITSQNTTRRMWNRCLSFNSLQTGKRITRFQNTPQWRRVCNGFNSLQTGKRITRKRKSFWTSWLSLVSIPFKRESGSQVKLLAEQYGIAGLGFNSLQTGKRITSGDDFEKQLIDFMFQFPSNGKADHKILYNVNMRLRFKFQFPSNGKADHKPMPRKRRGVLFQFQFPSNGKADHKFQYPSPLQDPSDGFNSLQTGKRITSDYIMSVGRILCALSFNSLQTGKRITSKD